MQVCAAGYRLLHIIPLVVIMILLSWQVGRADDITLRLKGGGGFQITGELRSFDGKKYTIINPSFGKMEIDAARFDCIDDICPSSPIKQQAFSASSLRQVGGGISSITITGSNAIGSQLMPKLVKAFAAKLKLQATQVARADPQNMEFQFVDKTGVQIALVKVKQRESMASFQSLKAGKAHIGMSSRPVNDKEVDALREAGLGNMRSAENEHSVALDGLIILTSPENPAISMSMDDIAKVFSGQITNWVQLGYPPGQIKVHAPGADSGTWETFNSLVLKPRGLSLLANARRTNNHAEQSDWVALDPLAIGVVAIAYQRSAKPLNIETACGLIIPPSHFSIKTEEYPLTRHLFLYTPGRPKKPLAAGLLDFALSAEAQTIVRKTYFVDQSPEFISLVDQGNRIAYALNVPQQDFDLNLMREFLTDLKNAGRLTFTFRFKTGSFLLDSKSRQYVTQLVKLMQNGTLKGKPVRLLGFADAGGSFKANLSLSQSRAEAVRQALIKASNKQLQPSRFIVKGYGELAPVACNSTTRGKTYNRRVEVWVDRDQ